MIDDDVFLKSAAFYAGSDGGYMAVIKRTSQGEFIGWVLTKCYEQEDRGCDVLINAKGNVRVFSTLDALVNDANRNAGDHNLIVDWA